MKSKSALLILLFITLNFAVKSQVIIDSICFNKTIIDYSIDATGSIFLSFEGGSITKFSSNLDSLFTYSPTKVGNTRLLEAGNGLRIFAFYDFYQEYLIANRFLTQPVLSKFSNSSLNLVEIATQSQDNNIWLVENNEFRLLKFNNRIYKIEIETNLSSIINYQDYRFTFLREYQNQVFLVDQNSGIYIFDNLGNYVRKIESKTNKCTFSGNSILYIERDSLVVADLYSSTIERHPLPIQEILGVLKFKKNTYFVKPTCLFIAN